MQRDHGSVRVKVARTHVFEDEPVLLADIEVKMSRITAGGTMARGSSPPRSRGSTRRGRGEGVSLGEIQFRA